MTNKLELLSLNLSNLQAKAYSKKRRALAKASGEGDEPDLGPELSEWLTTEEPLENHIGLIRKLVATAHRAPERPTAHTTHAVVKLLFRARVSQNLRPFTWVAVGDTQPPSQQASPLVVVDVSAEPDSTTTRRRLILVSYDQRVLTVPGAALELLGLEPQELFVALQQAGRIPPADSESAEDGAVRWHTQITSDRSVTISTLTSDPGDLHLMVGRYHLRLPDRSRNIATARGVEVDLLLLPRLAPIEHRPVKVDHIWSASGRNRGPLPDKAMGSVGRLVLRATLGRTSSLDPILRWLELAEGTMPSDLDLDVPVSLDDDPSPIALFGIVRRLERAADEHRRQYVQRQLQARAPSGRILTTRWFSSLATGRPDRVPVTRHMLSGDTEENRAFRAAANWVGRLLAPIRGDLADRVRARAGQVEQVFSTACDVPLDASLLARAMSRPALAKCRGEALDACNSMLEGRYPGLELPKHEVSTGRAFELNLTALFEDAWRVRLGDLMHSFGLQVDRRESKGGEHPLRWRTGTSDGERIPKLKPDLVIRDQHGNIVGVGDVKYKLPVRPGRWKDGSFAPLQRYDFHQIMAYLQAFRSAAWGLMLLGPTDARRRADVKVWRLAGGAKPVLVIAADPSAEHAELMAPLELLLGRRR